MKKFVVLFLLFVLSAQFQFSTAQEALKQGVYNIGGSILGLSSKNKMDDQTTKYVQISISPSLHYFVADNFLLGGSFSFDYYESKIETNFSRFHYKSIGRFFTIEPSLKYYFGPGNFIPFLTGKVGYSNALTGKNDVFRVQFETGAAYFISTSVDIEPFIAYQIASYSTRGQDVNTIMFGIRIGYFIVR